MNLRASYKIRTELMMRDLFYNVFNSAIHFDDNEYERQSKK
jgi:cation transport regulator ChaB